MLQQMPPQRLVQQAFRRGLGLVFDADPARLVAIGPCEFMDRLQVELAALDAAIHQSYFPG
jgi:hypothetical protein